MGSSHSNIDYLDFDDCRVRKNFKKVDVADCLMEMLSEHDMLSSDILSEMSQLGVSRRTVFSAKKEVGIQAYRENNYWYWRLPDVHSD